MYYLCFMSQSIFYVVEIVLLSVNLCSSDFNIRRIKSFKEILTKIGASMDLLELQVVRFEKKLRV